MIGWNGIVWDKLGWNGSRCGGVECGGVGSECTLTSAYDLHATPAEQLAVSHYYRLSFLTLKGET